MKAIYIAAVITTIVALAVYGAVIYRMKSPADRLGLWLAFLIALPLQPLAFYLVRLPFNAWLVGKIGSSSLTYEWITLFYAPLTEEPAKLVPLLVPFILRDIRRENFVRYALAIGLGFGIGEMWFVAQRIAINPQFASIPLWQFTGFFNERLMVCLLHSAFVSVALWRLGNKFLFGEAGAMLLHFFGNFPIYLMSKDVFGQLKLHHDRESLVNVVERLELPDPTSSNEFIDDHLVAGRVLTADREPVLTWFHGPDARATTAYRRASQSSRLMP